MDVFLLYSRWEGLSISILEAMASGLPIVASDIKGNNELVDESNGILIDIDRKSKLVKVLSELPERRQELMVWSRNSSQKVEHIYNYERFIAQYREIYGA
jgi:glycosyltransferase involved in cell wall biosynthesis